MKSKLIGIALIISLIVGLFLRLKDVRAPLADWHSWRQSDTASVALEYVKHGIDLLHPTYQDLSTIPAGIDNPKGYRMVEFPIISALVAWIYRFTPTLEIHVLYRICNIVFSLISALFIFLIVRKIESPFTGWLASTIFLILPYNIFYSRTILPEVAMVTASLAAIWFGINTNLIPLAAFSALALLIKPVAIFLLLPLIPYLISTQGKKVISLKWVMVAIVSVVPLLLWRRWITQFPEGIPASDWLLNGNGIRFKGAFFYWIFADRIGRIILGYWGVLLLALGVIAQKKSSLIFWWTLCTLAYLTIFATGNVQHDYYQIPIIPIIAILVAYGIQYLRRAPGSFLARYLILFISLTFMLMFSWYHVRGLFGINNPAIVSAGKAVDQTVPRDAKIIAPYGGDTAFLYQTNRQGWPIGGDIDHKISLGATHYVTTSLDTEAKELITKYGILTQTPEYTIIQLK